MWTAHLNSLSTIREDCGLIDGEKDSFDAFAAAVRCRQTKLNNEQADRPGRICPTKMPTLLAPRKPKH